MFVDEIKVYARAGHGGKGCVAFQREKYRPKGGPSGGNGGRGGEVILEADHDLNNLIAQYYQPRLLAQDGDPGLGKGMDGHAGKDLLVKVPCGTLIWDLSAPERHSIGTSSDQASTRPKLPASSQGRPILRSGVRGQALEIDLASEPSEALLSPGPRAKGKLIADLTTHGQQFVLCKGGRGGLGNRNFATAARQTPRFAQPGEPGEEGDFLLELRMIADVGLIGYPNAGKSTLLSAISHARPRIAPYPFTTLHPQIGIVEYPDYFRLVVCDVPGLIEGAHRNVGLGHEFLRHIERCKILALLVDIAGTDGREPWQDYQNLLNELEKYDPDLLKRPRLILANKIDEPIAEANLKTFKRRVRKVKILPISAAFGQGLDEFKNIMREAVESFATSS